MEVVKTNEKSSVKKNIFEWVKFILQIFVIFIVVTNTIGLTKVSGFSMSPTLKTGSILIENKLSTHFGKPKYGDVVIINEKEIGYNIIKRVIALPGDTVFIKNGTVYVNGKVLSESYTDGKADDMKEIKVEDNKIFVMGDNRTPGESLDSRSSEIGTIPISYVKGYAMFSVLPIYKITKP